MIEFYIVISIWMADGTLRRETTSTVPTLAICERMLLGDVKARIEVWGNAKGDCLATPPRPAGLPEPGQKRARGNASV